MHHTDGHVLSPHMPAVMHPELKAWEASPPQTFASTVKSVSTGTVGSGLDNFNEVDLV